MSWEAPFESDFRSATMDALFEINAKLADIREHLVFFRRLVEEGNGEEEEDSD